MEDWATSWEPLAPKSSHSKPSPADLVQLARHWYGCDIFTLTLEGLQSPALNCMKNFWIIGSRH